MNAKSRNAIQVGSLVSVLKDAYTRIDLIASKFIAHGTMFKVASMPAERSFSWRKFFKSYAEESSVVQQ